MKKRLALTVLALCMSLLAQNSTPSSATAAPADESTAKAKALIEQAIQALGIEDEVAVRYRSFELVPRDSQPLSHPEMVRQRDGGHERQDGKGEPERFHGARFWREARGHASPGWLRGAVITVSPG